MQPTEVLAVQVLGQCGGLLPSPFLVLRSPIFPSQQLLLLFASCPDAIKERFV